MRINRAVLMHEEQYSCLKVRGCFVHSADICKLLVCKKNYSGDSAQCFLKLSRKNKGLQ